MVAGVAAGLVLAGCGSSGQSGESSAPVPVESGSASGAVAADDVQPCPSGPPLTAGEGLAEGRFDEDDGAFGTLYNETGVTVWVRADGPGPSGDGDWCALDAGRGAAFGGGEVLNMDVTTAPESRAGTSIHVNDPWLGLPKVKTYYERPGFGWCGARDEPRYLDTGGLEENEENWLNGKEQGSVVVKRHPDSKSIAREWIGTDKADDWARIDLHVKALGTCG